MGLRAGGRQCWGRRTLLAFLLCPSLLSSLSRPSLLGSSTFWLPTSGFLSHFQASFWKLGFSVPLNPSQDTAEGMPPLLQAIEEVAPGALGTTSSPSNRQPSAGLPLGCPWPAPASTGLAGSNREHRKNRRCDGGAGTMVAALQQRPPRW